MYGKYGLFKINPVLSISVWEGGKEAGILNFYFLFLAFFLYARFFCEQNGISLCSLLSLIDRVYIFEQNTKLKLLCDMSIPHHSLIYCSFHMQFPFLLLLFRIIMYP